MLTAGTRLGQYEIRSALGSGGMGEVYRAVDTKLQRSVAIKILPESFAADEKRLARFEHEARTLAALNHPNIAIIHGFEEAQGTPALVMELVEGTTLAERIAQGPLPLDEALPIARQIAEALEAAHDQSIIHRDLKPANIKVRDDGTVKVLDFGLAKAFARAGVSSSNDAALMDSPTIASPVNMTEVGGIGGRPNRRAFAVSPDGRTIVFSAIQKNQRMLYARPLSEPAAVALPGTEGAVNPFFSPDGQWVGYWAAGQIQKVTLRGTPPVVILAMPEIFGASWDDNDRIVFARGAGSLLEVAAAGGALTELTQPDPQRGEVSHRLPHVLPGGEAILFTVTKSGFPRWDETEVWLYSRTSRTSKRLFDAGADARYVSSGHLVYAREGVLLAVPFDRTRLEVTGGPVGVLSDVMQSAYMGGGRAETGAVQADVSSTGTLVYIAGGVSPTRENDVVQVDRTGRASPLAIPPQDYRAVRLSPDGSRLALSTLGRERGIWTYSFARGTLSQLAAAGRSVAPVWTPDSERIVYSGGGGGPDRLHAVRADGGGSPELLLSGERSLVPGAWTPDGRHLLYYAIPSVDTELDGPAIWTQDVASKSPPRTVVGGSLGIGGVDMSPDGRWMAYHSRESGRLQVHVEAFPGPGPRYQVSTDGGGSPIWRADGRELYYARANDGPAEAGYRGALGIIAVDVSTQPNALSFGSPRQLFAGRYLMDAPARGWDVSGDGQRFLLRQARERPPEVISQMHVVQHWQHELTRLVPVR